MRDVYNYSHAIHFSDGGPTQIAEPRVGGLGTAVSQDVAPVIGKVHHANAELKKQADLRQLFGDRIPFLGKRHAIAAEVKTMPGLLLGCLNVVRNGRP